VVAIRNCYDAYCAKDCVPHNRASEYKSVCICWFLLSSSCILTFMPYFLNLESTQPIKHANKILVSIFVTMKATILDTQDSMNKFMNS
jgi:hypothetical protein